MLFDAKGSMLLDTYDDRISNDLPHARRKSAALMPQEENGLTEVDSNALEAWFWQGHSYCPH